MRHSDEDQFEEDMSSETIKQWHSTRFSKDWMENSTLTLNPLLSLWIWTRNGFVKYLSFGRAKLCIDAGSPQLGKTFFQVPEIVKEFSSSDVCICAVVSSDF